MKLTDIADSLNTHEKVRAQLHALGLTELGTVPEYGEPGQPARYFIATGAGVLVVDVPMVAGAEPTGTLTPWAEVGGARLVSAGFVDTGLSITGRLGNPKFEARTTHGQGDPKPMVDFIKLCMKHEGSWATGAEPKDEDSID